MDLRPHPLAERGAGENAKARTPDEPSGRHFAASPLSRFRVLRRDLRIRRRWLILAFSVACLASGAGPRLDAEAATPREYQIKSAIIYNFVKFIDWPTNRDTITVCVLGQAAYDAARSTINGKSVAGKTLLVRPFTGARDTQNCEILFVSSDDRSRWRPILDSVRNTGVLTIGESEGFVQSGGIINFYTQSNKLRFEINRAAADRAGLRISSQLLRLARVTSG